MTSRPLLRPFTRQDRTACLDLFDGNVPRYFRPDERAEFEAFVDDLPGPFFVLENPDRGIVACGGVALEPGGRLGSLCWGIVRADLHRQGIGRIMLLERLGVLVGDEACAAVRLETIPATEGFFRKLGFQTVESKADGHAPELDLVEMRLTLTEEVRARVRNLLRNLGVDSQ